MAGWLHLLKRRRNQLNGRGQCVASCGVWQAFAVSWLCALPIHKKPPRRRQAAGHREIVAQEGRYKEAQEFPSFARKPREVLLVDRGFLWVWFLFAQVFASTPVDLPEFRIHIWKETVQDCLVFQTLCVMQLNIYFGYYSILWHMPIICLRWLKKKQYI